MDLFAQTAATDFRVLREIYDVIVAVDVPRQTIETIQVSPYIRVPQVGEKGLAAAIAEWTAQYVLQEDQEYMEALFGRMLCGEALCSGSKAPQFRFRFQPHFDLVHGQPRDILRRYAGALLDLEQGHYLFCCNEETRHILDPNRQAMETRALKKRCRQTDRLLDHLTESMLAFEVEHGNIRPLYISDNMCYFFGMERERFLHSISQGMPAKKFLAKSPVSYKNFQKLLQTGEGRFEYIHVETGDKRLMKALFIRNAAPTERGEDSGIVVMQDITEQDSAQLPLASEKKEVYIRTFGYFDVFVNGRAIMFRHEKAKELLAVLVDRRGGFVSAGEVISCLWEEESANRVTLSRCRKVALRLRNILQEYGIEDIIETVDGQRRLVPEKVKCDLYDYLSGDPAYKDQFKGSYLLNYSWAEVSLGELMQ